MTAIQSRTFLQPQYPAADTKKIQKLNETSFAWKTARVVAVVALIAGALKVHSYYNEHTSPPYTATSSSKSVFGDSTVYSRETTSQSSMTWLGDVTKITESQSFENEVLISTSKQTIFSPLFGPSIIEDCRKDIKIDLETCMTITDKGYLDSRLTKQCYTYRSSPQKCYDLGNGVGIYDQSLSDLHEEFKKSYVEHAQRKEKE